MRGTSVAQIEEPVVVCIADDSKVIDGSMTSASSPQTDKSDTGPATPDPNNANQIPELTRSRRYATMATLCLCTFLAAIDVTIVTTAAPSISTEFGSWAGYSWIGSAYLLGNGVSTPIWAKLSDIYGSKGTLLLACAIFLVGSGLCGGAVNMAMLLIGRGIQGLGAGGIIVLCIVCISEIISMRNRGFYIGILGVVWALAGALGPVFGGIISEHDWRWCFYLNVPATAVAMAILFLFLSVQSPDTPLLDGLLVIDYLGCCTIVGGTVMFLLGLEFGGVEFPWRSATVVCLLVFGVLMFALFVLVEWSQARYPVLPLRLFKSASNIACFIVCSSHGWLYLGGSFYLPTYLQVVKGVSPMLSGIYFMAFPITLALGGTATGAFTRRTGRFLEPTWLGLALMTLGFGLMIDLEESSSVAKIIVYEAIAGLGIGPINQTPLIALQRNVPQLDVATATAAYIFIRILAASISVVIGGVIFQAQMRADLPALEVILGKSTAERLTQSAMGDYSSIIKSFPAAQQTAARTLFGRNLRGVWILWMAMGALGLVASFFISGGELRKAHVQSEKGLKGEEAKLQWLTQERLKVQKKDESHV